MAENTLIIFTRDNGGHSSIWQGFDTNGPLRGYKRDLTEGGIRVPFIARWKKQIPAGVSSDKVIAFQDMMPTFAELAGISCPESIDGISITKALYGEKLQSPHEYLYWDYGHCRDRYDQAVRFGKWKGIREGNSSDIQLYDLEQDIGETQNLAAQYPEIVSKIDSIMHAAVTPSDRYVIGQKYSGSPIWEKNKSSK